MLRLRQVIPGAANKYLDKVSPSYLLGDNNIELLKKSKIPLNPHFSKLKLNTYPTLKLSLANIASIKKREYILSLLLVGSMILGLIAFLINLFAYLEALSLGKQHRGDSPMNVIIFNLVFVSLFILMKKGYSRFSSLIFISIYLLAAFYTSYFWGADVPQSLLIYSLCIIITGILLGGRTSFIITFIIVIYILSLTHLQTNHLIAIESHWKNNILDLRDSLMTSISLFIITTVSWLSNREMERSLERAEVSEKALKAERDLLETRVAERTKELQHVQMEKITQLYRFADFGRLASGLMHDLVNPLTSVSLNIEHISSHKTSFKAALKRAKTGIQRMESYVEAARKQIQQQETHKTFSVRSELKQILKIFSYREKKERVALHVIIPKDIKIYGNPVAFHQAISNIVANAFDAYESSARKNKEIIVSARKEKSTILIDIQDHGKGITSQELQHIFEPFFTTKNLDKGTGIGLSISKKTIEQSLGGSITVESTKAQGTVFHLSLPLRYKKKIPERKKS